MSQSRLNSTTVLSQYAIQILLNNQYLYSETILDNILFFTYFHLMKRKITSLTAEPFVCRCHWIYFLVLTITSCVLHSVGMVSSLPLPDSYKSTGAVNPETNKYLTDYPIVLLESYCHLHTLYHKTVLYLISKLPSELTNQLE
jgi:hypothetical protein